MAITEEGAMLAAVSFSKMTVATLSTILVAYVYPQMAGMLGGLAYLMVRHELGMASMRIGSIVMVMFFGWLGAWATVNIFAEHGDIANVWVQISSATVGFLSYDAMMMFGGNTQSVIGFFTGILKGIIEKGVRKWKS